MMLPFALLVLMLESKPAALPESVINFRAVCEVSAVRNEADATVLTWKAPCRLQDLLHLDGPEPGYSNKWRVLIYGKPPDGFRLAPIADYIRAATLPGGLEMKSLLWGQIQVIATDESIQQQLNQYSGYEVRPQRMQVTQLSEEITEVLFWEKSEEFDVITGLPSPIWQQDSLASHQLLGRAH